MLLLLLVTVIVIVFFSITNFYYVSLLADAPTQASPVTWCHRSWAPAAIASRTPGLMWRMRAPASPTLIVRWMASSWWGPVARLWIRLALMAWPLRLAVLPMDRRLALPEMVNLCLIRIGLTLYGLSDSVRAVKLYFTLGVK